MTAQSHTAPQARTLDAQLEFAKWIAILAMLIDHAGVIFADKVDYLTWRSAGRLCWPLIAWIVALRLYAAPERTMGYLKRLLPWALLSQLPYGFIFNYMYGDAWFDGFNILITIAFGCSIFAILRKWDSYNAAQRLLAALAILLICVAGIKVDYAAIGVVTIPVLAFIARDYSLKASAIACGIMGALANLFILLTDDLLQQFWILPIATLPASLIALFCLKNYIPMPRLPRWFFYAFYPAHLILLISARIIAG